MEGEGLPGILSLIDFYLVDSLPNPSGGEDAY